MKNQANGMQSPATKPKKPYSAPDLIRWGNLQEVTLTGGKASIHADGGTPKGNKQTS